MASLRYSTHVMQNSSALNVLIKFHLTIAARNFFFPPFSKEFYHTSRPLIHSSMKVRIPFCWDSGILTVVRFYEPWTISIRLHPKQESWDGSRHLWQCQALPFLMPHREQLGNSSPKFGHEVAPRHGPRRRLDPFINNKHSNVNNNYFFFWRAFYILFSLRGQDVYLNNKRKCTSVWDSYILLEPKTERVQGVGMGRVVQTVTQQNLFFRLKS